MRFLAISLSVFLVVGLQQQNKQPQTSQSPTDSDQRGTEQSPLVVKAIPAPKTPEETAQETKDRDQKTTNDRDLVKLTAVLALVGFFQFLVYAYQAKKLRETVESAGEQAEAMERHIGEAARSATAMEKIVTAIEVGNKAVMRAYLTVVVGSAVWQERREGQSNLKFEGRTNLVNTGNTPARKVRVRIQADILPVPLPKDFEFPLPEEPTGSLGGTVGAHQTNIIGAAVKDLAPDAEVAAIKEGTEKALYVWGLITYEDMFGDAHTTKFGQWLTWWPNNQLFVYYLANQNDGD